MATSVALFFFALFLCCIYSEIPSANLHSMLKPSVMAPSGASFGQYIDIWRENDTTSYAIVSATAINISHVYRFVEVPLADNLTIELFQIITPQPQNERNYGQFGGFSGAGTMIVCGEFNCEILTRNSSNLWEYAKTIVLGGSAKNMVIDDYTNIAVAIIYDSFGTTSAYALDLSPNTTHKVLLPVIITGSATDMIPIKISNGTIYIGDFLYKNITGRVVILDQTSPWNWTEKTILQSNYYAYGASLGVFNEGTILAITGTVNKPNGYPDPNAETVLEIYRDMDNKYLFDKYTFIEQIGILDDVLIISQSTDLTCLRTGNTTWLERPYGLITAFNIPKPELQAESRWGKTYTSSSSIYLVTDSSDRRNMTGITGIPLTYNSSLEGSGPIGVVYVYYCRICPFCKCRSEILYEDKTKIWPDYLAQCDCGTDHEDTVVIPEDVIIEEPFTTVNAPDGYGNLTIGGQLNVTIGGKLTIGNNSVVNVKNETVISGNLSLVVDLKSFNSMKETVNDTTTVYTVNVLKSGGDITYDENKVTIHVINSEDLDECEILESKAETSSDKRSLNVLMTVRTKEGCGGAAADSNSDGISGGAIAGIVIGVFAGLVIVIAVLVIVIIALKVYRQKHLFKA